MVTPEITSTHKFVMYLHECKYWIFDQIMQQAELKKIHKPFGCEVDATLSVIGGRWKPVIIFQLLQNGMMRFGALRKEIEGITERMLTKQLRELEGDQIVHRKVYAEVPPRVEYSLTEYGRSLKPIMISMRDWGAEHAGGEIHHPFGCSVEATLSVIGGRWKPIIIFKLLQHDVLRFGAMRKEIDGITERMLTNQLRELEKDAVIKRKVYAEVPPRVEYSLNEYGHSLEPIMTSMRTWGAQHMEALKS